MKMLIFLLQFFVLTNVFAENKLTIDINKYTLSKSEEALITIKNNSKKEITYTSVSIEKLMNKEWNNIRTDITCPCLAKCKEMIIPIKYNQSREVTWDLKTNQCTNVSLGVYRVIIHGKYIEAEKRQSTLSVSKQFEIVNNIK